MKIGLILSGLQRNFEPFIENQKKCIIEPYNMDVFIYTSNINNNRYIDNNEILYKGKNFFENNEEFFFNKYGTYLKDIYIDYQNKKFNELINNYDISETKSFHINLIQAYFKIYSCIELLEAYEKKKNFKYDIILRGRLDCFVDLNFEKYNINKLDSSKIYLTESNNHKDDCCILFKRDKLEYIKSFIFYVISIRNNEINIHIEKELLDFIKKKYILEFLENYMYRIGTYNTNSSLLRIPHFNHKLADLYSLEYQIK